MDVEALWDAEIVELNTFHTLLNSLDPNLKFSLICDHHLHMYKFDNRLCMQK